MAKRIARELGLQLGSSEVSTFSDGEISCKINETVREADVYIVQPTSPPVNNNLMELLIMTDAMRRASARQVTAVIPYFGYARQDRKARARDPISAKLVADLITTAGANRVLSMDLHCFQIQGFFNIPVDHLYGANIFIDHFMSKLRNFDNTIVVSPDLGSVPRARNFADALDVPLAIVDKRRPKPNVSEIVNIIGDVAGKTCILIDDVLDTAGTLTNAAAAIANKGAAEIYACCTHAVLSGDAIEKIKKAPISELIVLDTVNQPKEKLLPNMKVLSVAPIFANAINRIHEGISVSKLFER